ncbi:MAG: hypothetical protein EBR02_01175 [Alphaproteobacteria bacterium]|nr:hypothetical protein [Alphaproteobacteria bacterium]
MILQCPECNARYAVPDHAIGKTGRTVACAKCKHSWHQMPTPERLAAIAEAEEAKAAALATIAAEKILKAAETPAAAPQTASTDQALADFDKMIEDVNIKPLPKGSNVPAAPRKRAPAGIKAATVGVSLIAASLAVLLFYPALYGYTPTAGMMLEDLDMHKRDTDNFPAYEINGKISNRTGEAAKVPVLRVTLVDSKGSALQFWEFSEKEKTLKPGQAIPFSTGALEVKMKRATRFVLDIGNPLEMSLRSSIE